MKMREKICRMYEITINQLMFSNENIWIEEARHIYTFFLRQTTELSLTEIGRIFNKKHSTVLNSLKQVENLAQTDKKFRQRLIELGII